MRAYFEGQNIFALGNGIAVLRSVWSEAEQPCAADKKNQKIKRAAGRMPNRSVKRPDNAR